MEYPLVYISIVHWNGGDSTIACIKSVLDDGYPCLHIVLIDNGSTDAAVQHIEAFWPQIKILRNTSNTGFTGGHNRGMRFAHENGAAYVMLLNQDALLSDGCIGRMVALAESEDRIGLVSPMIYFADEPGRCQYGGSWLNRETLSIEYSGDPEIARMRDADTNVTMCLWGTALLVRRAVIDDIGVLDDRFFAYYEDSDYSVRAAAAGWRNRMCFDANILHEGHPTRFTRAPNFFYFMARNAVLFWKKTLGGNSTTRVLRKCVARSLLEAAKLRDAGNHAQADACIVGLWDAFRGRSGGYVPKRTSPFWLRWLVMRHPYFLANLLQGRPSAPIATQRLSVNPEA